MDLILRRTEAGLVPKFDSDLEALKKIKIGEDVKVKISRPRNINFHRKYFALMNLAFENQDLYDDITTFRYIIQMKAGFYTIVKTHKGELMYFPDSISFGSMDESKFEELYSKVLDVILQFLEIDKETVENELINFM